MMMMIIVNTAATVFNTYKMIASFFDFIPVGKLTTPEFFSEKRERERYHTYYPRVVQIVNTNFPRYFLIMALVSMAVLYFETQFIYSPYGISFCGVTVMLCFINT